MTDVNGMSLNFIGGGAGGQLLVDCHTLGLGKTSEELPKMVSSGKVVLCK